MLGTSNSGTRKTRKYPKRFFLALCLALCATAMLALSVFAAPPGEASNTVRVGVFPYDGQLTIDSEGNYSGYGFDYLQEISRYTGWRYEFVDSTWEEALAMLERGELDLMGAVMKTSKRQEIYDFSNRPMISGYGILATPLDNEALPYGDFKAFDGLKVGTLNSNQQAENFMLYSRAHGFSSMLRFYHTQEELLSALALGEIKAVITASPLSIPNLRIIAKFGENDAYFATPKGKTWVSEGLNDAMQEIQIKNPYYNSDLNQKYLKLQEAAPISFSREELDYIKSSPPIRCVYDPDDRPISYFDKKTNEPGGIAVDLSKLMGELTGLSFELIPVDYMVDAEELLFRREADLILSRIHDFNWAQKSSLILTDHYLEGKMAIVTNGSLPESPRLALPSEAVSAELKKLAGGENAQEIFYASSADCLQAVRDGKADATLINSNIAAYESNNPRYARLTVTQLHGYSANTCMAVSGSADPLLLSIMNKALENISAAQINQIISTNMNAEHFNAFLNVLYARPVESILLISGSLLLIAFILLLLFYSRAKNARAMKKMLYTDELTGYPNHRALTHDAVELLARDSDEYALFYMDMHQFKALNDTFGYAAGDRILKAIAEILHDFIETGERFSRTYADRFVMLLHYSTDDAFLARLGVLSERLKALSTEEFSASTFLFNGGICRMHPDFCDLEMAFDRASYARDTVKEHFTDTFVFYDDAMRSQILFEKSLESNMLSALEGGEFIPYFQPKVNIITNEVVGAEALVRWRSPEHGFLAPDSFLPFYEKNGFIVRIDFAMFEMVCRCMGAWLKAGNVAVPVSVNFSRRHVPDRQFSQKLKSIADRYGVPTRLLEIEITETIALGSVERAAEFSSSLKEQGFIISIDDFGTGYSSISFLQDLPLDVLKLDKEFVASAMRAPKARDLMDYMIMAMRRNGIRVLCEGVETPEQRDFIAGLNCCFAQGYLYAKPMPQEDFENYLRGHKISDHNYLDFVPTADFSTLVWSNAKDFIDHVMPGWAVGRYVDEGYPIFYISPEILAALGYSELEFQYAFDGLYTNCIHPEDRPRALAVLECSRHSADEHLLQYRLQKKDGGQIWIRDVSKRILTDDGREAILGICTDISDIVQLRQEKDALMNAIPGGICELLITPEGPVIQGGTENFYTMIGHSTQEMELLGNRLFAVIHDVDLSSAEDSMRQMLASGTQTCECTFRVRGGDGVLHWISIRGALRGDGQERWVTAVVHNMDAQMKIKKDSDLIRTKLDLALTLTEHAVYEYDLKTKSIYEQNGLYAYFPAGARLDDIPDSMVESGFVHPDSAERFLGMFRQIRDGAPHASCEMRVCSVNAPTFSPYVWVRTTMSTIYDEDDAPIKAVAFVENIDLQKRLERAYSQEEQYRKALVESVVLTYEIDLTHDLVDRISGNSQMRLKKIRDTLPTPCTYTELANIAVTSIMSPEDRERFHEEMGRDNLLRLFHDGVTLKEYEYRRLLPDGSKTWVSAMAQFIMDDISGNALCFVYYRDIQARKAREEHLCDQAARDSLTSLWNRASAERLTDEFLSGADMEGAVHAFLMLDVDRFKDVNDTHGHHFGDLVLAGVAAAIKKALRDGDIVARMGGDEFAALVKNLQDEHEVEAIVQQITLATSELGKALSLSFELSASIGVSFAPREGTDFKMLYRCADKSMYESKRMTSRIQ